MASAMNSRSPTPRAGAKAELPATGNHTARTDNARSLWAMAWLGPSGESNDTRSALAATTHAGSKCEACCTRRPSVQPSAHDTTTNAPSTKSTVTTGVGCHTANVSNAAAATAATDSATAKRTSTSAASESPTIGNSVAPMNALALATLSV